MAVGREGSNTSCRLRVAPGARGQVQPLAPRLDFLQLSASQQYHLKLKNSRECVDHSSREPIRSSFKIKRFVYC